MIISAYSPTLRKYGAVDDQTHEILIPYEYSDVQIQPGGVVVTNFNGDSGCYTLDGQCIYSPESNSKIANIVFLEDNRLMFTIPKKNKVAIKDLFGDFIIPTEYNAVLFFCGINFQAIEYSVSKDITNVLVDNLFYSVGGNITSRICVCSNNLWGVFDYSLKNLIVPCSFSRAVQYKDNTIILYDAQGNKKRI